MSGQEPTRQKIGTSAQLFVKQKPSAGACDRDAFHHTRHVDSSNHLIEVKWERHPSGTVFGDSAGEVFPRSGGSDLLAPVRATLAQSVNPNPESRRVLAHAFGLRKRPSKLGRALLNEREVHREQKRPKIAENFAHAGTKFPVGTVERSRYAAASTCEVLSR
jgi:hypothetical protein